MSVTRWNHYAPALIPAEVPAIDLTVDHGEVFTRRWVVEMILDLARYTDDRDLTQLRLVEPSCGAGAFLTVIAERVATSAQLHGRSCEDMANAVRAYDLLQKHVTAARSAVVTALVAQGIARSEAETIAAAWVVEDDYLLADFQPEQVDVVVGNPPYIRLEDVPEARSSAYRQTWPTMGGRADVFIGFFERGLRSLKPDGSLAFICADRWMRNQYGRDLRELVSHDFSMDVIVSMHDVDAFEDEVSAYPAVTVISNKPQGPVTVGDTTDRFGEDQARQLVEHARAADVSSWPKVGPYKLASLPHWFEGSSSWPQGSPERLAMVEYLTDNFPPLEDSATGTRVGIGVASGADKVFIVDKPIDVEPDRLLPLSMVRDLASGQMKWSGHYLVSPWQADGLVDLSEYPRLAAYFDSNASALKARHVAKGRSGWYRTIDRVDVGLTTQRKLLIPDMRMSLHPVLDEGETYPHHNLYVVTSKQWDARVLGGLLLSRVANAFVEAYAVKMRGGTLRFQAQYLRRIRLPHLGSVSAKDAEALAVAFDQRDVEAATAVALRMYGLDYLPE